MQELETTNAAAAARNPSPDQVCFFELALWGNPDSLNTILHDMRPAFSVGGFFMPPYRRNEMLIIDAGMALPPCGGYVEEVDATSTSTAVRPRCWSCHPKRAIRA